MQLPKRKRNRLKDFDYGDSQYYFITICTNEKLSIFGYIKHNQMHLSNVGQNVKECINNIECAYENVEVNKYVIMPNHIHMILALDKKDGIDIPRVIKGLKAAISKTSGKDLWQKSYFDHVIRDERDYYRIYEYVENNVLRWDLDQYYN